MHATTQKFPMIAMAGAISFLATLASFSVMSAPAKADSQLSQLPMPGFADPYGKTPILGYRPGESQIRLANMRDEGITTNYISIWGLEEKRWLGTVQVDVPAKASVQIEPHLMLETFAPVNWLQPVALYVENGREKQLWQHVRYLGRAHELKDVSVCTYSPHADYIPASQVVLNAYISRVGALRSVVSVHNFSEQDAVFEARLYDAGTGASLGKVEIPLAARETFSNTALWLFDNSDQVYIQAPELPGSMNIEFVQKAPQDGARVSVAHWVADYTTGETINLSNPCPITGGTITIPPLPAPQVSEEK
jgi:hypothetical protein